MAISVYELAKLKGKFRAFKTEENEIKTLKIATIYKVFSFVILKTSLFEP